MIRTGYHDPIPITDAHLGFDTEAIRRTAINVYGVPQQFDHQPDGTPVIAVNDIDLTGEIPGAGTIPTGLRDFADTIRTDFKDIIQHWKGHAYRAAESRVTQLANIVDAAASDSQRVGFSLLVFAEAVDQGRQCRRCHLGFRLARYLRPRIDRRIHTPGMGRRHRRYAD